MTDINGKWAGTIIYGAGYPDDIMGRELTFELTIHESDGDITGSGRDIAGCGINPSESFIRGFVDGEIISFIKHYKSAGYFDEDGGSLIIENEPSLDITYNGEFNADTNQYEGDWDILIDQVQYGNDTIIYEFTGSWSMRKVS
jgi:hypothetical protein